MFGWGLVKGLSVTMRHFIESYLYDRKPWEPRYSDEWLEKHQDVDGKGIYTVQYPEQERKLPENFRFIPMLIYEEQADDPRCTACGICARVCPPQCIWIERAVDDRGRPTAKPSGFWIDAAICMSCGYCAEYCPFDAIKMNQDYHLVTENRDRDMFYDREKLLQSVEYYAKLHPTDYAAEEQARQAKEEAKRKAAEAKKAAAAPKVKEGKKAPATPADDGGEKAAVPSEPDDLTRIEGIGPKIAGVLQAAGINTFAQLADTGADRLKQILEDSDANLLNLADPTSWPKQGRLAASGKWEALEKLQERLKAGREAS
jgi:NADH-quinone oxidoreductase subunit I